MNNIYCYISDIKYKKYCGFDNGENNENDIGDDDGDDDGENDGEDDEDDSG